MIRRSTLVILLILAVLLAVAFYLQRSNGAQDATATPAETSENLFTFDTEISAMRLEHVDQRVVEIGRNTDGTWKLIYPPAEATDIGAVQAAVSQLMSVPIVSKLENAPGLEETGLNSPAYRVLIRLEDGAQELLSVGNETPTGSGYYVLVSNRGMFIVNKYSLDPFLELVNTPPIQPTSTPGGETTTPAAGDLPAPFETGTPIP
jgi:hypothetical protein